MHNLTSCILLNSSHAYLKQRTPSVLVIILLLVSVWIIIVNALVFTCLLISKNTLRNFVNIQMLSFSLTDLFVGLSSIPLTLSYQITSAFPFFETCAGIFYIYCVSQTANLFHALGICLHRLIIIKRCTGRSERNPKHMLKTLLVQIAVIWSVSFFLVSIPFGLYGTFGETLNECSLNTLFKDKYINFLAIMNSIFFIPQIGMNAVYLYLFRYLLTTWRSLNMLHKPIKQAVNADEEMRPLDKHSLLNKDEYKGIAESGMAKTGEITLTTLHQNGQKNNKTDISVKVTKANVPVGGCTISLRSFLCVDYEETNSEEATFDQSKSNVEDTVSDMKQPEGTGKQCIESENENNPNDTKRRSSVQYSHSYHSCKDTEGSLIPQKSRKAFAALNRKATKHKSRRRLGYNGQKRVLITIGMILLVVNIFMTPLNLMVVIELINKELLSRRTKFVLLAVSLMNSALNPIIYALRIKPFKAAFARNWNKFIAKVCLCKSY